MFNDGEIGYEKANAPEFIHSIVQSKQFGRKEVISAV
jgi:hypothetical protein